jgi:hypothetical protein
MPFLTQREQILYRVKISRGSMKLAASPAFGSQEEGKPPQLLAKQERGKASPIINLHILPPKRL